MEFIDVLMTSAATGSVSTAATVIALRVHIFYLRETAARHERSINRAHERIDEIEKALK